MISDYTKWFSKNEHFLNHLCHHNSIIYNRLENIIKTLNFISSLPEEELNNEYNVIFDSGFSYLFSTVGEIQLYLEQYFDNNFHLFMNYDSLINYSLYTNELRDILAENNQYTNYAKEAFNEVLTEIDEIIKNKKSYSMTIFDTFDSKILSTFKYNKDYISTPEVFDKIVEELQL